MGAALKNFFNRNTAFDLFLITVGSVLWVIGLVGLIVPNGLLSVGFSGISILICNFIPVIPLSVMVYVINIPVMIWALKELNKRFLFYTFFALTIQSLLMELMKNMPVYDGDVMLAAIFAGVVGGLGSGLVIRRGGSGGGLEIVGIIIRKRWGYSVGTVGMVFNVFIVGLCAFLYGLEIAMYTIIFIVVFSFSTDKAIAGMGKKYTVMIVTTEPERLKNAIFDKLHRGVTFLRGKSAFSGDQKDVIYCAINQYELAVLKDMVYTIDPNVFMTIHETTEIYGHFRNKKGEALTAAEVEHHVVEEAQKPVSAKPDPGRPVVKVINRHGAVVDEVTLPGEKEDGSLR